MYLAWMLIWRPSPFKPIALPTDEGSTPETVQKPVLLRVWELVSYNDAVDINTVDLRRDEHEEEAADLADDAERDEKLKGRFGWFWRAYYAIV